MSPAVLFAAVALAVATQIAQFGPDPYEGLDELPVPPAPTSKCRPLLINDAPSSVDGGVVRMVGNTAIAKFSQMRAFADGSQTLLMVQLDQQSPVTFPILPSQKQLVMYFSNLSPGEHRLLKYTLKRDAAEDITVYLVQADCFVVKK
jgi:hypothetical protein